MAGAGSLTWEQRFLRFLYLCSYDDKFTTGDFDKHCLFAMQSTLFEESLLHLEKFKEIIARANNDDLLPRRQTIFFALATALNVKCEKTLEAGQKHELSIMALDMCKNDEEFFSFIRYHTTITTKKTRIPTTVKKAIAQFYRRKTPRDLADSYVKAKSYHSWKHKDLLKLAHYKPDSVLKDFVIKSIMFELDNFGDGKDLDEEQKRVSELLNKIITLRKTTDEKIAVPLILELHAHFQQMNSQLDKYPEVWASLIQEADLKTILRFLPKFYKMGFLKANSPVHGKVIEALTDTNRVTQSNLHPIEVFIHLKNFEKGGKAKDPQLLEFLKGHTASIEKSEQDNDNKKEEGTGHTHQEPKCLVIINSVKKCLRLSYNNVKPTEKRIMITIDASVHAQDPCLHNKNITCLQAAVALTMSIFKVEKDVIVATYNGPKIDLLPLDKSSTFAQICQNISQNVKPFLLPNSSVNWAMETKKNIDVFINFVHNPKCLMETPSEVKYDKHHQYLKQYQKRMGLHNVKLVSVCLSSAKLHLANKCCNVIDIAGFAPEVATVIQAFCKGSFN